VQWAHRGRLVAAGPDGPEPMLRRSSLHSPPGCRATYTASHTASSTASLTQNTKQKRQRHATNSSGDRTAKGVLSDGFSSLISKNSRVRAVLLFSTRSCLSAYTRKRTLRTYGQPVVRLQTIVVARLPTFEFHENMRC